MDKPLTRIKRVLYYYDNGKRIEGKNPKMTGDCSYLWGDCSGLMGDCTSLRGDCSELYGNLDKIPMEERKGEPNLTDWIQ